MENKIIKINELQEKLKIESLIKEGLYEEMLNKTHIELRESGWWYVALPFGVHINDEIDVFIKHEDDNILIALADYLDEGNAIPNEDEIVTTNKENLLNDLTDVITGNYNV